MNPLARIPSLKVKLGIVIVLAIVVTLLTMVIATKLGLQLRWGALVALALSLGSVQIVARGLTAPLREMARAADGMARGEHGQRVAATSRDEVGQLARLAEHLLDLSVLESGREPLERRTFEVAELARDCDARIEIPDGLQVDGDSDRLRQVVRNLVENAHRHAPGSPVVVRAASRCDGGVRLEVEDHGPGLDPGESARVFERFARSDRARSLPGAGLGLAIARSIVELHGGAIRAETAVPHGCRMVVELP